MEELTFLFSIRNGALKCFGAEACPKLQNMRLDLQPGANIENGTFSKITSFLISVQSPRYEKSRSKVSNNFLIIGDVLVLISIFFETDVEVQSRILQIVTNSNEYSVEVYTYDEQLLATLTLGEGRQRFDAEKHESPPRDSGALIMMQNRLMQMEQEKQQAEQEKRQAEQETEDFRRQIKQMQDDMKHQTRSWRMM